MKAVQSSYGEPVAIATAKALAQGAGRYQVLPTVYQYQYEVVDWQEHPSRRTMCITDKLSAERIARALGIAERYP